jgi:TonB family protein
MDNIRIVIDEEIKFAGDYDFPGLAQGGTFSVTLHGLIFLIAILITHHEKKNDIKLTEITMVDQVIPVPEEEAPPPPAVAPPKDKDVWDFLKKVIPVKAEQLQQQMPVELPKTQKQELAEMPKALDLGAKKNLDKPSLMDKPLDLVGKKSVAVPVGMDVNPLKMQKRNDSLATSSQLPTGIQLGAKSSFLPSAQAPIVNANQFARRANLDARGGALADMPTIKKPEVKKAVNLDSSSLKIERSGNTFKIFGALENRPISERYLPKYPRWAEEQGLECNVTIHFFVVPDGSVKNNLYVEASSGYPEMDNLAMKALRAFKFAPIASGEEQEGGIIFYFRLSR